MMPRLSARIAGVTSALLVSSVTLVAQPTIDGRDIPTEFAGATETVQRFQTQFGNCVGGQFCGGSELNRMFITNDASNLYIGITGNLENNGNCMVLLIDVDGTAGGANPLKTRTLLPPGNIDFLPRYLTGNESPFLPFGLGLHNLPLDAGFAPDYALGISGGSPVGSQTATYYAANWTTLAPDANNPANLSNEVLGTIETGNEFAAGPTAGTLGSFLSTSSLGILAAADNGNDFGVDGGSAAIDCNIPVDPNTNNPLSAELGFEFAIPLSVLGVGADDNVCVLALVSSPDGFISNQLLPAPVKPQCILDNLGPVPGNGGPGVDLADLPGDQFLCHTIVGGATCGAGCEVPGGCADTNGDGAVDLTDLANVLANFGGGASIGDTNGDGSTDLTDLANILALFGTSCP